MTLQELHERIGWQLEGRLQGRYAGNWIDWGLDKTAPTISCPASSYRRRPDPPPMPDEVWVNHDGAFALSKYFMEGSVRYVRAGAIIPASQIERRYIAKSSTTHIDLSWIPCGPNDVEYRIKP